MGVGRFAGVLVEHLKTFEAIVANTYPTGAVIRFRYRHDGTVKIGEGIISAHQFMTEDMAKSGMKVLVSTELLAKTGRKCERPKGGIDPPGAVITVNWGAIVE